MNTQQSMPGIVLFVDQINFWSFLKIIYLAWSCERIWYFEPLSASSRVFLGFLQAVRLIRADVRQVTHHIGHVKDRSGNGRYIDLRNAPRSICKAIRTEKTSRDPLISSMASHWSESSVLLHFEKVAEQAVLRECQRIGLAEWMQRTLTSTSLTNSVLLIKSFRWYPYLKPYATENEIRLARYSVFWINLWPGGSHRWALEILKKSLSLPSRVSSRFISNRGKVVFAVDSQPNAKTAPGTAIGVQYYHRSLSFDPSNRSEFSWLKGSGIPASSVVLYKYTSTVPLSQETLKELADRGVKLLGKGPGAAKWFPTSGMLKVLFVTCLRLARATFDSFRRGQLISVYSFRTLAGLAVDHAYWCDFYNVNKIQVNLGGPDTKVSQVLALETIGAVSIGYQQSVSNIYAPTAILTAGQDVQFVFSSLFEKLWRGVEAPTRTFVHTGLMFNISNSETSNDGQFPDAGRNLKANGAEYIITYFDESSINRWFNEIPDSTAADEYRFFLEWLLEDPTIGVIAMPKRSSTLRRRIGEIRPLIERAEATGRFVILTSDNLVGNNFPASAAGVADLCVGKILGSTACLETRLAGVPSVLVDGQKWPDHPFWSLGSGQVVFDEWSSLRSAVERYRRTPDSFQNFGDWGEHISHLDRFQDGQGGLRMGQFVKWLTEAYTEGVSKYAAIDRAADRYIEHWGAENLTQDRHERAIAESPAHVDN